VLSYSYAGTVQQYRVNMERVAATARRLMTEHKRYGPFVQSSDADATTLESFLHTYQWFSSDLRIRYHNGNGLRHALF